MQYYRSQEKNKRPIRCGKHHGPIKSNGEILRILYQKYTETSKKNKDNKDIRERNKDELEQVEGGCREDNRREEEQS